ncbi:MAG TPA: hypothetical protein VF596_07785 [Pyrinomonadaceae bacterium]|jgi:hypothetical protein
MNYPNTPRGNAEAVQQILFRIQALFRLLILVDDENALTRVREGDFFEALQYVGELGEDTCGRALHHISLVELQTNDSTESLEQRFTLPVLISAVLNHPETSQPLADMINDALRFMAGFADNNEPQTIEVFLKAYKDNGNGADIEVTRANGVSVVGEGEGLTD